MPLRTKRRSRSFDVPVHDLVLRVTGPEELYEEARAVGMQFWEQVQSYGIRHPGFQTSKRPLEAGDDAPPIVRQMCALASRAGVGPMFAFQGALTESVGQAMARSLADVMVVCGPNHFIITRKRSRLALHRRAGDGDLAIVVKPELGPHGVHISFRSLARGFGDDGVVIVASSCASYERSRRSFPSSSPRTVPPSGSGAGPPSCSRPFATGFGCSPSTTRSLGRS